MATLLISCLPALPKFIMYLFIKKGKHNAGRKKNRRREWEMPQESHTLIHNLCFPEQTLNTFNIYFFWQNCFKTVFYYFSI